MTEARNNMKGQDEWHVLLEKLPMPSFMGKTVGDKLCYPERDLPAFFEMVKDAADLA